jgi:predicted GIY-YIG superfamily endonuclease
VFIAGKGTSSRDGASLSGALLEELVRRGLHGMFATHLHEMLQLALRIPGVEHKRMSIEVRDGRVECTYRLQDGTCTDSLALVTARQYGIDEGLVRRAEELGRQFDERVRHPVTHSDISLQDSLLYVSEVGEAMDNHTPISHTTNNKTPGAVNRYDLLRDVTPLLSALLPKGTTLESVVMIATHHTPPASLEGQSCLYVLHIHKTLTEGCQSRLYVGETESVRQRLDRHRSHFERDGWLVECLVVPVAAGGKSSARKMETRLIRKLKQMGFHLDSCGDEKHSLFGSSV